LGTDPCSRAPPTVDLWDGGRIEAPALNERRECRLGVGAEAKVGERTSGERDAKGGGGAEGDGRREEGAGLRATLQRGGREMGSAGLCGLCGG
jgi:hypothetical protein